MIVGYWQRGEHCLHTHVVLGIAEERAPYPGCGVHIAQDTRSHIFDDDLAAIDCRRCLRMLRKQTRERIAAIDKRLDGKCGLQRDAFK